ncbi:MAG: hypothetical protein QXP04_04620 [Candidatus Nanoarchaeia archaeon]|nr:hypothetical protein [Candidatus Jingweiarchaeum tengchongense]
MITYTFPTSKNPTLTQLLNALSSYVLSYPSSLTSNTSINGAIGIAMKDNIAVNIQIKFFENVNEYSYTDPSTGYKVTAQPLTTIPSQSEIQSLIGDYL